ncbi:MAG: hypothetical protein LBG24_02915 [Treponema sp.]|jgi:hypothetical protein|nr:hypothetical protein [Treponema sp.]
MDRVAILRKEMQDIIDSIPEYNLYRLRPLLDALIETDPDDLLSDEEEQLLEQCRNERKEHPETFAPWCNVRKGQECDPRKTAYTMKDTIIPESV